MASRTGKLVLVAISDPGFTGEMSKYEITNAQYCRFLNEALADQSILVYENRVYGFSDTGYSQPYFRTFADSHDSQIIFSEGAFEVIERDGYNMSHHPVVEVSWYGATAFCEFYGYRLPSSQEWQAVADFDGSYEYGCGPTIDPNSANYDTENPIGLLSVPYTSPVGYYPAQGYGLCDLAGNVWEWTSSASGPFRTLRSGAWTSLDIFCSVSSRSGFNPRYALSDIGFRVCR
jgi:formylglycine-generating enzyme required for sulfatase activity